MKWLEISVQCDGEAAEAVAELFNRYNSSPGETQGGAVVEVGGFDDYGEISQPVITVRTYLADSQALESRRKKIEEGLWFLGRIYPIPDPVLRELAEEDWATAWRKHYHAMRVGSRLIIVPAWQAEEIDLTAGADRGLPLLPIILDPGMAFGTGLHPTTRLCLAALERSVLPGQAVLDVGCGSGVLSIAAARLGAAPILATDIDPIAVTATVENCARNGLEGYVEAREGSLPDPGERPAGWPVIVANILADVIVLLLVQGLSRLLAAEGRLILSGIIEPRAADVVAALDRHGLRLVERTQEGDWVCLIAESGAKQRV
jgi:ribosomal protein L11 methyltransferase